MGEDALPADAMPADAFVALRFEDFYSQNRDELARALGMALRDSSLGAEAADEAFARACQRWADVSVFGNPKGWIYRVGLNWGRSWLRRMRRERDRRMLFAQPDHSEDLTRDVDLERALASLNDSHRAVIVARFYLDWSVTETADALGIAVGTVKSRLSRGLDQLRAVLEPEPEAGSGSGSAGQPRAAI